MHVFVSYCYVVVSRCTNLVTQKPILVEYFETNTEFIKYKIKLFWTYAFCLCQIIIVYSVFPKSLTTTNVCCEAIVFMCHSNIIHTVFPKLQYVTDERCFMPVFTKYSAPILD